MDLKVKLIAHTAGAENVVAKAARLCYSKVGVEELNRSMSYDDINKMLNILADAGHESPIEHANFTFAVEGISRACSHQIVRHRIASFSQQSQRYVKLEQFDFITPPAIQNNAVARYLFKQHMKESQKAYDGIVDALYDGYMTDWIKDRDVYTERELKRAQSNFEKKAIEDARYVFPNACETKMVFTMNARSLMNFFAHRCCDRAQWEIREVADKMLNEVKEICPILFKHAGPSCVIDRCPEGNMSCGRQEEMKTKYKGEK